MLADMIMLKSGGSFDVGDELPHLIWCKVMRVLP